MTSEKEGRGNNLKAKGSFRNYPFLIEQPDPDNNVTFKREKNRVPLVALIILPPLVTCPLAFFSFLFYIYLSGILKKN